MATEDVRFSAWFLCCVGIKRTELCGGFNIPNYQLACYYGCAQYCSESERLVAKVAQGFMILFYVPHTTTTPHHTLLLG
jgi:hypothetical protein